MPELPEVETVRRQLAQEIVGEEIAGVEVRDKKCFVGQPETLIGEKIKQVRRVGKYLLVVFESGRGLVVHLKMTGRLIINKPTHERTNKPTDKFYETATHTRVVMKLRSGRTLYYWDTRKFGYVKHVEDIRKQELGISQKLGPEPWDLSDADLLRKLQKTGRKVKEILLDQTNLAGVGNIYANDALHLAGIDPRRTAKSLESTEVKSLLAAIRRVMERGLATNGASDNSYLDAYGEKGAYQNEFRVYGKTKGKCITCEGDLSYGKVGGRGTWWCDNCQK